MRVSKANHRQYNGKTKRTNNDLYKILHRKLKIEQRNLAQQPRMNSYSRRVTQKPTGNVPDSSHPITFDNHHVTEQML